MTDNSSPRYELRELGVGGVLDQALRIVRDNFGQLLLIFLPLLLFTLVSSLTGAAVLPVFDPEAPLEEQLASSNAAMPVSLAIGAVTVIGSIILGSWINAALIHFIAQKYLGNAIAPGEALARGWSRFGPLLGTSILYTLTVMLGFLLLIIPGIYFTFWYLFSQQVTVVEKLAGWGAMKRSRALMKGSMNVAFLLLLVVGLLNIVVGSGANLLGNKYLIVAGAAVLQGLGSLLGLTALVVFYFSCRCKTENFDLEHLTATLGGDGAAAERLR
jgi:hypothetical protein